MSPERTGPQEADEYSSGNASEQVSFEQEYDGYAANQNRRSVGNDPDVVLDVPVLNVDELDLEVDDLRAHVSLRAELADLVKVNVGVDVYLDKVKIEIKGVEAQALLKVKLERVLDTLDRALEAIDRNPQILGGSARSVDRSGRVTETVPDESNEVDVEEAESKLADLQIEEEYVDGQGRIVGRARDESGNVVEEVLNEEGDVLDLSEPEEAEDQEDEDDGEVDATDAARRKADELGVKLSGVRGTGSGGRILARDVEKTANHRR